MLSNSLACSQNNDKITTETQSNVKHKLIQKIAGEAAIHIFIQWFIMNFTFIKICQDYTVILKFKF